MTNGSPPGSPTPMAGPKQPVDWMLAFKFNDATFHGCDDDGTVPAVGSAAIFGGTVQAYKNGHSQQYVFATSANPTFVKGPECLGATLRDPLGATFSQVFDDPHAYYVIWNDQFKGDPIGNRDAPWGHSKGLLAWSESGEGMVLQVSTPSWPGSGSRAHVRKTGNTLGAIGDDDDVEVSQHFFALRLTKDDLLAVLRALINANVCTDIRQPQLVRNGGPTDVQALVKRLGALDHTSPPAATLATLSSQVRVIAKPSALHLPPWQLVSATLGGVPLRVASWWEDPKIYSTDGDAIEGWPGSLGASGAVEIATTGTWDGTAIGLTGGGGKMYNHAKLGVSTDASKPLCIFGDMNQQGAIRDHRTKPVVTMASSQNGRGGTFYVLENATLFASLSALLKGATAPRTPTAAATAKSAPAKPSAKKK